MTTIIMHGVSHGCLLQILTEAHELPERQLMSSCWNVYYDLNILTTFVASVSLNFESTPIFFPPVVLLPVL